MDRSDSHGFSMLEVMVALAILAASLSAIAGAHNAAGLASIRTHKMLVAAQLVRGIVLDVEEEYQIEGFPENDRDNEDCEVPEPWDQDFECKYSLEQLDTDAEVLMAANFDAHPLISEALLDYVNEQSANPAKETVILVGHGPEEIDDNELDLQVQQPHVERLAEQGGFA